MIRDVIDLSQLTAPGLVLDVAGGGEGMIGHALGRQVVSIDISRSELEEVSNDALKLVMDAADMSFLDGSFTDATCFFGLMYMPTQLRPRVLAEVFRVLAPGGRLRIWDAEIPSVEACGSHEDRDHRDEIFLVELEVMIDPGEHVRPHRTTYGVGWDDKAQTCCSTTRAAVDCGFVVLGHAGSGRTFHLSLLKPYGTDGQLAGRTPTGVGPMRIVRAAARDLQDAYGVLADSCRRVVSRGRPVPHWLFAFEGQQHVADKIRDCDYFIGYIDDSPAGAGIGAALLEWASSYIASRGRSIVRLECDAKSPGLCAYYESLGFQDRGLVSSANQLRRYERRYERRDTQQAPWYNR